MQPPACLLVGLHVGDGDEREARLDRLVEGERDGRRRRTQGHARRRHRLHQVGVGGRRRRHDQRDRAGREKGSDPPARAHAICLPPREKSAIAPSTTPIAPTTSAMIASVEVPPPPSELFASIVGAGASEDSDPDQLTIEPSE